VQFTKMMPVFGLLTGATVWGLIWYPYRALEEAGISGEIAATLTYACAFVLAVIVFRQQRVRGQLTWSLAALGLSAGWANVGFTVAVVYGDVMRVVLLFYLAPLWTVWFARLLLGEKLSAAGYVLMLCAFSGAIVMLWQPQSGWPLPRSAAEWTALSAGVAFALSNVLARLASATTIPLKVMAVFAGGIVIGVIGMGFSTAGQITAAPGLAQAVLLLLISIVILSVNVAVQYGLAQVGANRAIVIYLFELVVAAFSAWVLADEVMTLQEWCGGAMIVAAGLVSGRLGQIQPVKSVN
jgi:drug/metabolite transporter (DMT)-like permease